MSLNVDVHSHLVFHQCSDVEFYFWVERLALYLGNRNIKPAHLAINHIIVVNISPLVYLLREEGRGSV